MKNKVLTFTFSVPLLWATLLLLSIIIPGLDFGVSCSFSSALLTGMLIGALISRLFWNRKFVTDIAVNKETVSIMYLTPLARQRQITLQLSSLTDIKLKKKLFLIRDFDSIRLVKQNGSLFLYLLTPDANQVAEKLKDYVESHR